MRITQDALTRFGRPFAAAVAGVAMLGAMAVAQPKTANAADDVPSECNTVINGAVKLCNAYSFFDPWANHNNFEKWIQDSNVHAIYVDYAFDFSNSAEGNAISPTSHLYVDHDVTVKGIVEGDDTAITDLQVHVRNGAKLTLGGNLVIDNLGDLGTEEKPVTVENGTLNLQDTARLETNGGADDVVGVLVPADAPAGTTVNLNSTGDYGTKPTVYGASGAVVNLSPNATVNVNSGTFLSKSDQDYPDGGAAASAIYSAGTLNFNGGNTSSIRVVGGVANIKGGKIATSVADQDDSQPTNAKYPLRVDAGVAYVTGGTIAKDTENENVPAALYLEQDAKAYFQAQNQGDVTLDSTQLWVGQLYGASNGFTADPSVGARLSSIPGITNAAGNVKVYANYGFTDSTKVNDLPVLVQSEADAANVKTSPNSLVENNDYVLSSYVGYHGTYGLYAKYKLNNTSDGNTFFDQNSKGEAYVYSVPTVADYEWYSAAEISSMQQAGEYPDATRDDQSYVKDTYTGRKFAGWFKSGDDWNKGANFNEFNSQNNATTIQNAVTNVDGTQGQTKFGWAHFADAKNLTVGAQASEDGKNIRFLSTLDSRKYQKFGFKLSINYNGQTKNAEVTTTKLYDYVTAAGQQVKPNQQLDTVSWGQFLAPDKTVLADDSIHGGQTPISNGEDGYFTTTLLKNVPADLKLGSNAITVTPYWVTLDGTIVYGDAQTK